MGNSQMIMMRSIAFWPVIVALGIACFTDIRSRRIPNSLVLPFALAGVVASCLFQGKSGLWSALCGISLAAIVCGVFCYLRGMGMGDLKLCAAIGAWIGPEQLGFALVITSITGGIMALCWAAAGGFLGDLFQGAGDLVFGFRKRGLRPHSELVLSNPLTRKMPYAPAIAIGTIVSFFSS